MKTEPPPTVKNCDTVIKDNGSVNIAPIHRLHYNSERIVFQEVLKNILKSDYTAFKSCSSQKVYDICDETHHELLPPQVQLYPHYTLLQWGIMKPRNIGNSLFQSAKTKIQSAKLAL